MVKCLEPKIGESSPSPRRVRNPTYIVGDIKCPFTSHYMNQHVCWLNLSSITYLEFYHEYMSPTYYYHVSPIHYHPLP